MDKNRFLDALTAYSRNPCPEIPAILDQYLNGIAANGETLFHWPLLKPLLFAKMEQVIGELQKGLGSESIPERPNVENIPFDTMHARIVEAFHKFNGAPFTIQRLCELLIDPMKHYKRSDKFLRGLEKNVLVVSTVDPFGRNVVSEIGNKHLVNGMDTVGSPFFPRDSSITSNLPPVPGWVTSAPSVTSPQSVAPTVMSDQKQSQASSQDSAVTTSVLSGAVVTSLYGEQPQASQTEEVVEETVVTMDTSESSVVPDSRETGSEEEGMGSQDSNTSSSSSSSSEELSTNDTSDSSSDVPTTTVDTYKSHTSPWVSVATTAATEGDNKVHVSSSDAASEDLPGVATHVDSSVGSDKSASETLPSQSESDGQADSFLPSSGDVNSSSSSDSESSEKSGSCSSSSSLELPVDTCCVQQDSYNDSTGFDTAFTSEETNTLEHSSICPGSENVSDESPEASDMETTSPSADTTVQSSQPVDSSSSEAAVSTDASFQDAITPASKDEHSCTHSLEEAECSLDSSPPSPPTQPVDLSSTLHASANRSTRMNPSSPDSPSDCQEPQAKRRKLSHESSPVSSADVTIAPDLEVSSNTPGDMTVSSESDSISTTRSNTASDSNNPDDTVSEQNSDNHDEPIDSETAVNTEPHEDGSEGRECVASPPSQEASSSDSQGFDATVESQHIDTEATNTEESSASEEFDQVEEVKKTEEQAKEEDAAEGNLVSSQN